MTPALEPPRPLTTATAQLPTLGGTARELEADPGFPPAAWALFATGMAIIVACYFYPPRRPAP